MVWECDFAIILFLVEKLFIQHIAQDIKNQNLKYTWL